MLIVSIQLFNHYQRLNVYERMMEENLIPVRDFGKLREELLVNRMNLNSLVYLTGKNYERKFDQLIANNSRIDSLFDRYMANRDIIKDYSHFDSLYNRLIIYKAYEEKILELLAADRYTTAEKLYNRESKDVFSEMIEELDQIDRDQARMLSETAEEVRPWILKSFYLVLGGVVILLIILILHLTGVGRTKNIADS
ncbi:MCP four helix bundle domain-containing protein [Roseivirga sp. BDSF3-8]|uniref:MCP four helix bundle domain-containing protein n=1 Tax=Roseivirga sp. BDSF3-8 TaxID=3241598 RepID=UPI0035319A88